MASYLLPALAGRSSPSAIFPRSPAPIWPGAARALGVEDRTASGRGYALTFDDGPHPRGHPGGARDPRRSGRAGDVLPRRRAGAAQPRARREIARRRSRDRPALRPPPQPPAPGAVAGARGHRPGAASDRGRPPAARRRCTARPTACSTRRRCAWLAHMAGGRCCGPNGAATGRRAPRPSRSPRASPTASRRARCCCCTTPTTIPRRAPGGAPSRRCRVVLDVLAERGLEPVAP